MDLPAGASHDKQQRTVGITVALLDAALDQLDGKSSAAVSADLNVALTALEAVTMRISFPSEVPAESVHAVSDPSLLLSASMTLIESLAETASKLTDGELDARQLLQIVRQAVLNTHGQMGSPDD